MRRQPSRLNGGAPGASSAPTLRGYAVAVGSTLVALVAALPGEIAGLAVFALVAVLIGRLYGRGRASRRQDRAAEAR